MQSRLFLYSVILLLLLVGAACDRRAPLAATPSNAPTLPLISTTPAALAPTVLASAIPPTATQTALPTPTPSPSPSPTRVLTGISTLAPTPTATVLRGQVLVDASCHYGPGVQYLYKYALIAGSNLEIIGRDEAGAQLLVRAIGGNNPCWVKTSRMAAAGDVMTVAPVYIPLPQSPYYGPLTGFSALRSGSLAKNGRGSTLVTVSWKGLTLREGDGSGQYPYLLEAWVCRSGRLVFTPIGTYDTAISLLDEPGCLDPSHARLAAAEKHGYTAWVEIPWPAAPELRCLGKSICD